MKLYFHRLIANTSIILKFDFLIKFVDNSNPKIVGVQIFMELMRPPIFQQFLKYLNFTILHWKFLY